jgi:hypothetical protein
VLLSTNLFFELLYLYLLFFGFTVTIKQAILAINIVKIRICNKIEYEFIADYLMLYIEREIIAKFCTDSIINDF